MENIIYIPIILLGIILAFYIVILWVEGIDTMNEIHKDYKGEDFLDEDK